jgi:DeoR/GlpR family transcriptional regulator of sugar metabolism
LQKLSTKKSKKLLKSMSKFKGTKGEFNSDIGIDQLSENQFQILIDSSNGDTVAAVYGKTADEAQANARLLAASKELLSLCKHARIYNLSKELKNDIDDIIRKIQEG